MAAVERALALDPSLPEASRRLIVMLVEGGDLTEAHGQAVELLRRRPDSADAHFSLAYVLRYAGLLEEAGAECDASRRLDPRNSRIWRSCALNFLLLGRYDRVREYLEADHGSTWARNVTVNYLIRQEKLDEAAKVAGGLGTDVASQAVRACLEKRPKAEVDALAGAEATALMSIRDSEPKYFAGAELARCGYPDLALRLIRRAVEQNFCAYPALDRDPLLASIRGTPEFAEIRKTGIECQKRFLAHRNAAAPQ